MNSPSKYRLGNKEQVDGFLAFTNKKTYGITTGIPTLDQSVLGLQGIVGIVGEPKACKSTLALQLALHNAKKGIPVFFWDRENGWSSMVQRVLSGELQMPWLDFCRKPDDQKLISFRKLGELPFELCTDTLSQEDLQQNLMRLAKEYPKSPNILLVLDSLHKLPMSLENMRMSVDGWLLFLDSLKLAFNRKLVTLVTCEKRRGAYGEAMKDAAKESGRIEYTLEQQIDMRVEQETGQIILEVLYNRHGPADAVVALEKIAKGQNFLFRLRETNNFLPE